MGDKKYYWLKLKRDFFKRHDIQIIEDMPNGKDYILFYVKLLCESVDHDGRLRFNEEIPYNEEMLATITRTNVDIVRSAVKVFSQLQMMEILDDGTIYMREVQKMLGGETYWAEKKRLQRQKKDNVQLLSNESPTCPSKSIEKEIEIEIELEKDINNNKINNNNETISSSEIESIFNKMKLEIEDKVPDITYETYFRNLKCRGIKGKRIVLEALPFVRDVIVENHTDLLMETIQTASDGKLIGVAWEN